MIIAYAYECTHLLIILPIKGDQSFIPVEHWDIISIRSSPSRLYSLLWHEVHVPWIYICLPLEYQDMSPV